MHNYKENLKGLTEILLKEEDEYGKMKETCDELFSLFFTASELEEDEVSRKDLYLPKGKAIGTFWAGVCVKEFMRTKRFIRGIFFGIKKAQEKFPDRTIHILYAGTGPFGTLMLPLTTVFTSKEIKFTLLEINHNSIEKLKNTIRAFEAEEYVEEIIQCDATEYKAEANKPIHMIITETMQRALVKEPQVAITLNLVPQMVEGGILIPQSVNVEAALIDPKRDSERMLGVEGADQDYFYPLGKVFELNKNMAAEEREEGKAFQAVEINVPETVEKRYKRMNLLTNIQVFDEEKLTYMQCSLNLPQKVMDIDWLNNPVRKVQFQYVIDKTPGFVHSLMQ